MDDDSQIRERNSKIVSSLLQNEKFCDILPIYAQELYLNYLIEILEKKFGRMGMLAVLVALYLDENAENFLESSGTDVSFQNFCLFLFQTNFYSFTFFLTVSSFRSARSQYIF